MVEEVPTDVLEGRFWRDGGHGRLGRGVAIAHSTAVPSGCDVLCHPWLEQGGFCAGGHPACALVGCVEGVLQVRRSLAGMTIRSPYVRTPSTAERESQKWKKSRVAGGIRCRLSGGPYSMTRESSCRVSSAAVAIWIASQLRGMLEMAAQRAVERPESSSSVGGGGGGDGDAFKECRWDPEAAARAGSVGCGAVILNDHSCRGGDPCGVA